MDAGFYSADYLRAWIRSAQLRALPRRARSARTGGAARETGERLRALFREGTRPSSEEIAARHRLRAARHRAAPRRADARLTLLTRRIGLDPSRAANLDDAGHISGVDPLFALDRGVRAGEVEERDLVLLLATGTRYTMGRLRRPLGRGVRVDDVRPGLELGPSEWREVTQDRIDAFAAATDDPQWIHVDPQRAAAGPFGTTIAHGYLDARAARPLRVRAHAR